MAPAHFHQIDMPEHVAAMTERFLQFNS